MDDNIEFAAGRDSTDLRSGTVTEAVPSAKQLNPHAGVIGRFRAIGVSGNDLLGSVLYTCGGSVVVAGPLAPVTLFIVNVLLYGLRFIFGEVVTAFPVNGGAYNALLNTTSKFAAALGACFTFLDGLSLCVVSAASAVSYVQTLAAEVPLVSTSVGVIVLFGLLIAWGLKDSATVAVTIFSLHVFTLTVLTVAGFVFLCRDGGATLARNWEYGWPDITSSSGHVFHGNVATALWFGVAQGFLGVTGFETTANYVEELKRGVFRKTMREMWRFTMFFNPVVTLLSLCVLDIPFIIDNANTMLVFMGQKSGGTWLGKLVAVDAAIVLTGGVLTAYVGATGVMKRLALDRCLPQVLLKENKWRRTNHVLVLVFLVMCVTLLVALNGDLNILGLVLDMAFLGVMGTFVVSCVLLKMKRFTIAREEKATSTHVILGAVFVVWGIVGTAMLSSQVLQYFLLYYACAAAVVICTMQKRLLLRLFTRVTPTCCTCLHRVLAVDIAKARAEAAIFFCKTPDCYVINKGVLYVRKNEAATRLIMVHVYPPGHEEVVETFRQNAEIINKMYPKLVITAMAVEGEFGPHMVDLVCRIQSVPSNMVFIGCPSSKFICRFDELGKVRVVTRHIPTTVTRTGTGEGADTGVITVLERDNTFSFASFDGAGSLRYQSELAVGQSGFQGVTGV